MTILLFLLESPHAILALHSLAYPDLTGRFFSPIPSVLDTDSANDAALCLTL